MHKVIRSVCYFTKEPSLKTLGKIDSIAKTLEANGFEIQTKRICSSGKSIKELDQIFNDPALYLSVGTLDLKIAQAELPDFYNAANMAFNVEVKDTPIIPEYISLLFEIIKNNPSKTFKFTYVFNNRPSSPYFPSASYELDGFAIGLQPTDLSEGCKTLEEWLKNMKTVWLEIAELFKADKNFLGIDSSIAPLFTKAASLVNFIKGLGMDFSKSVTTDTYLKITNFIKTQNSKPVGLCGLMFPCLEDFDLAEEYEQGNFSIERNLFLSLHSGLGIDTYPIGIDERPERVMEILDLTKGLSDKYQKPLSVRFVSDGKTKIGEKTNFQNQFLKDVVIKKL